MRVRLQKHYKMQAVVRLKSAFQLLSVRLIFLFYFFINIVQDSLGYGFIPAVGKLDLNTKAIGRRGFVFASVLRLWHLCNIGRYIGIVTGLLLMQLIGLTDQCNISILLFCVFVAHHGRQLW